MLVDQSRCCGYQECVRGCPYRNVFFNPMTGTSEKCIACFPRIEQGMQPQCFVNCIGKIRLAGFISKPDQARADNPMDYLVHIKKAALPLFPQFDLEPNVYYLPPVHAPVSFNQQLAGPVAAVVSVVNGPAKLFRNVTGGGSHWLAVRLRGRRVNRQGLGAVVQVRLPDGHELFNQATTTVGYACSSEALVRFGLGSNRAVGKIRIRWPGRAIQQAGGAAADRIVEVVEEVKP